MEFTLLAAVLTGAGAAWLALRVPPGRFVEDGTDWLLGAAGAGLVSGRILAMAGTGTNPLTHPGDFILIRGGVDTVGAVVGMAIVLTYTQRHALPRHLDALAPAIGFGLAGWHAGCLWRSSCLGVRTAVPWGWGLPGSEVLRHPVEVYAAIMLMGVAILASRTVRPWRATGIVTFGVAATRLVTQPLRLAIGTTPTWFLILGLSIGVVMIAVGGRLRASMSQSDGHVAARSVSDADDPMVGFDESPRNGQSQP